MSKILSYIVDFFKVRLTREEHLKWIDRVFKEEYERLEAEADKDE